MRTSNTCWRVAVWRFAPETRVPVGTQRVFRVAEGLAVRQMPKPVSAKPPTQPPTHETLETRVPVGVQKVSAKPPLPPHPSKSVSR